jgi:hypothetical protein
MIGIDTGILWIPRYLSITVAEILAASAPLPSRMQTMASEGPTWSVSARSP